MPFGPAQGNSLPPDMAKIDAVQTWLKKQTFQNGVSMQSGDVTGALGFTPLSTNGEAASAAAVAWSGVSGKPTDLAKTDVDNAFTVKQTFDAGFVGEAVSLANGVDLDTVIQSGFYRLGTSPLNAPASVDYGQLVVSKGSDTIFQIVTGYSNSLFYMRHGNGIGNGTPSFSPWAHLYTDQDGTFLRTDAGAGIQTVANKTSFSSLLTANDGFTQSAGYWELGPYDSSRGSGFLQGYYDANNAKWILLGRDSANNGVPFTLQTNGDITAAGAITASSFTAGGQGVHGVQTFTSNGTFTVPPQVSKVFLRMWGGGGGGGATSYNTSYGVGYGGGPGYFVEGWVPVSPGQVISVTVGSGGAGGIGLNSYGNVNGGSPGNTSSFGSYISASGGYGGSSSAGSPTAGESSIGQAYFTIAASGGSWMTSKQFGGTGGAVGTSSSPTGGTGGIPGAGGGGGWQPTTSGAYSNGGSGGDGKVEVYW